MIRTYTDLMGIKSFKERVEYLRVHNIVGEETFGGKRLLNQYLYHSPEWRRIRREVIFRDSCNGDYPLDLAHPDHPIFDTVYIHHLNPITIEDVVNKRTKVFDMENLICVSFKTHQAIHYQSSQNEIEEYHERKPNDTTIWR